RKPRRDFPHLEHDWANLFPTCVAFACNQRRTKYPDDGLASPGEGVEVRVQQELKRTFSAFLSAQGKTEFVFRAVDPADVPAVNTARELNWIHNGTGSFAVNELRLAILGHM